MIKQNKTKIVLIPSLSAMQEQKPQTRRCY